MRVVPYAPGTFYETAVACVEVKLGVAVVMVAEQEIGPAVAVKVGDRGTAIL